MSSQEQSSLNEAPSSSSRIAADRAVVDRTYSGQSFASSDDIMMEEPTTRVIVSKLPSPTRPVRSDRPPHRRQTMIDTQPAGLVPPRRQDSEDDLDDDDDDYEEEDDTVTGNWSIETTDDEDTNKHEQRQRKPPPPAPTASFTMLNSADLAICQRLDEEYERALEEREIAYTARFYSVRQSACFSVAFMVIYLTLATVFFLQQAEWSIGDSILFSIYTITTVGYGHLEHPETVAFQLYTITFIFIGIATLTIMVAQVYQCIALEASRAQHSRDQSEMARRGMEILSRHQRNTQDPSQTTTTTQADHRAALAASLEDVIHIPPSFTERVWDCMDRLRAFFSNHEIGKALSVLFPFLGLILIGAIVIGPIEGWTVTESLYFSVVSLTTVGFGDYYPTRTASIWFCVLWLPFSIGFMSLFLANVAAFYIRLSDKNVERIERQLKRQVARSKQRAERELAEARRRALRGQEFRDVAESDDDTDDAAIEMGEFQDENAREGRRARRKGFDTIPTSEGMDNDETERASNQPRRHLFGSKKSPKSRRDMVISNSNYAVVSEGSNDNSDLRGSTMSTMRDVIRTVKANMAKEEASSDTFRISGPESEYLSIRSQQFTHQAFEQGALRKPTFALRALVQERFSEIIATDIAGYTSNIEIHDNTLTVTIEALKQIADKWLVPRRARKAFRSVTFEALFFVGEHGLITRGAEALYDLSPFEFHGLFAPLLAAMGDAETMEGWLASTQVLADVDLRKEKPNGTDPQEDAKIAARKEITRAFESTQVLRRASRPTPGSAASAVKRSMDVG